MVHLSCRRVNPSYVICAECWLHVARHLLLRLPAAFEMQTGMMCFFPSRVYSTPFRVVLVHLWCISWLMDRFFFFTYRCE